MSAVLIPLYGGDQAFRFLITWFDNFQIMRTRWVLFLLFLSLQGTAQRDTSGILLFRLPDSTGIGTADGDGVSSEIGPSGGKLISSDGRIELVFPAGALTDTKAISIQPTKNLFDSAVGKAYLFGPSGLHFKKPVRVVLHYSNDENETCPADLMSFAMQDDKGHWTSFEYDFWDSTAKILSGNIHHFSGFTNVYKIQLRTALSVMCEDSVNVEVLNSGAIIDTGDLAGQLRIAEINAKNKRKWFANGKEGGNVFEGYMEDYWASRIGNSLFLIGRYRAPWFFPKKNPVKLSLGIRYYSQKQEKFVWGYCTTKIIVFDAYKMSITHAGTAGLDFGSQINDGADFVAAIFPKTFLNKIVSVEQITNYAPVVVKNGKAGPFKEINSVVGAEGSVHITDQIKDARLSDDYPPKVFFEFNTDKVLWRTTTYTAPGGVVTRKEEVRERPIPFAIYFNADGQDQYPDVSKYARAGEEVILKITRAKNNSGGR